MVSDAQTEAFKYRIVYLFDRSARNRQDSVMYKEISKEKYGKRLFKRIHDSIDTGIAKGMFYARKVPYRLSGKVFCIAVQNLCGNRMAV